MRAAARSLVPSLLACLAAAPAAADCLDFDTPGLVVEQGVLRGLPPGDVTWRSGRLAVGGGHLDTLVELRWRTPEGEVSQRLFTAIQDGRPRLRREGALVRLAVTYCPPGGAACRETGLTFAWDAKRRRFSGTNGRARTALDALCGSEDAGPG